jgi:hypothetical protein
VRGSQRLEEVATRLSRISRESRYDPYRIFEWPESLPDDQFWMSPELMTCYGTQPWEEMSAVLRLRLSRFEVLNFFSLNVHLIRELIGAVAERIYTTRYPVLSEFFHDFIAEENVHAWFFATFCQRYGGKVYPPAKTIAEQAADRAPGPIHDLSVFGRILIAEELCDYFNKAMTSDERLPAICRQINKVHHEDESRHIAFGRQIMRALSEEARDQSGEAAISEVGHYLARYITTCVRSFYRLNVYADAGVESPASFRRVLLASRERSAIHREMMGRTTDFLTRIGVFDEAAVQW